MDKAFELNKMIYLFIILIIEYSMLIDSSDEEEQPIRCSSCGNNFQEDKYRYHWLFDCKNQPKTVSKELEQHIKKPQNQIPEQTIGQRINQRVQKEQIIRLNNDQIQIFSCPNCQKSYPKFDWLDNHFKICELQKQCNYCIATIPKEAFQAHINACRQNTIYKLAEKYQNCYKFGIDLFKKIILRVHDEFINLNGVIPSPQQIESGMRDLIPSLLNFQQQRPSPTIALARYKSTGLKEQEIDKIPSSKWKLDTEKNNQYIICAICQYPFCQKTIILNLNCGDKHIFHRQCINDWLRKKSECPICRAKIYVQNAKHQNNQ